MIPTVAAQQNGPKPTSTACGCTVTTGTPKATPTGGLSAPAGPVGLGSNTESTAQANLETYRDQWKKYTNAAHGFSFDFPAVYESDNYNYCAVREDQTQPEGVIGSLSMGSRTRVVLSKTAQTLQEVVDANKNDPANKDFQFDPVKDRTVGGTPAVTLPYRSGGTNRYAEVTFFIKDGVLYQVIEGTPSACDVPGLNLRELDAYSRLLNSFSFKQ